MASFELNPLFYARAAKKVSLATVAAAVHCSKGQLSRIERLEAKASPELAEKLAEHFGDEGLRDKILFPHKYVAKKTKKPVRRASSESVSAHG